MPAPLTNQSSVAAADVHSLYDDAPASKKAQNPGDSPVAELYKPVEESPTTKSVALAAQPITAVDLTAKPERDYASLTEVPDLSQLPWSLQQEIPSISYAQHNFVPADENGVSSVVINGQPRRAHSAIAPQLTLEEIFVDGVVLRFRDHSFKLRALNNWVNM